MNPHMQKMSHPVNDGGPAFPEGEHGARLGGMSLRDWFAGQALAGIIAAFAHPQAMNIPPRPEAARDAYQYADAMLAEREKRDE